jgi:hypothetical protein
MSAHAMAWLDAVGMPTHVVVTITGIKGTDSEKEGRKLQKTAHAEEG